MEGHAGTRRLNPTDAEDAPDESVAVSEQEQTSQEPEDSPPEEVAGSYRKTSQTVVRRVWGEDGWPVSARAWCASPPRRWSVESS